MSAGRRQGNNKFVATGFIIYYESKNITANVQTNTENYIVTYPYIAEDSIDSYVITYKNGSLKLFLNGKMVNEDKHPTSVIQSTILVNTFFGFLGMPNSIIYHGTFERFLTWRRELSPQEILRMYKVGMIALHLSSFLYFFLKSVLKVIRNVCACVYVCVVCLDVCACACACLYASVHVNVCVHMCTCV